jgi:hypothetical protein
MMVSIPYRPPRSRVKTLGPLDQHRWLLRDTALGQGAPTYGELVFGCVVVQGEPMPWLQVKFFN